MQPPGGQARGPVRPAGPPCVSLFSEGKTSAHFSQFPRQLGPDTFFANSPLSCGSPPPSQAWPLGCMRPWRDRALKTQRPWISAEGSDV